METSSIFRLKSLPCWLTSSHIPWKHSVAIGCSMPFGDMRIIRPRVPSIRTSFISDKSSNQIPRSRVLFLPFTAVAISLSDEVILMTPVLLPQINADEADQQSDLRLL